MNFFQAIILGFIQGITEFLPISSSAHLVLVPYLLKWEFPVEQIFPFDVLVQMGTLLAVIIYFRRDLLEIIVEVVRGLVQGKPFHSFQAKLGWYLVIATIPAGLLGILIKSKVEEAFKSPAMTAVFLLVTAGILFLAERIGRKTRPLEQMNWKDALWIGIGQAISIFPGVSRSGSTIASGVARNLDRRSAGRFSFLMSIPVMLAAGILSIMDLGTIPNLGSFFPKIAVGIVVAAVIGYLSIHWLLTFLSRRSLTVFSIYCAVAGILVLLVIYL